MSDFIYGLHDKGGEHLLTVNGEARGWILVTEDIGHDPNDHRGSDYGDLTGFGVIVRLNNAYGPAGTIPHPSHYLDFARRVANFVANSYGCHTWVIGNEMNMEREQPRQIGRNQAEPITPRQYATCYRLCRDAIRSRPGHEQDKVLVGPIAPWNGQTPYEADSQGKYPSNKIPGASGDYPYYGYFGDYILYLRHTLLAIGRRNCDGIAIHAYSHGYDPVLVTSSIKMGPPFENYHYNFLTYRDQMNTLPMSFRDLPIYITEANGDRIDGQPWPNHRRGWIQAVYREINFWNTYSRQPIRCVILFRWQNDHENWGIEDKASVQQDLYEAVSMGYRWQEGRNG